MGAKDLPPNYDAALAQHLDAAFSRHGADPAVQALVQDLRKVLATPGAVRTDLRPMIAGQKPSLLARVGASLKYAITGVTPATWFGPSQPLQPQADKPDQGTQGRRFDFGVGSNLQYTPKTEQGAGVPYWNLRGLAENYDLLRLVIETRKDQMCAQEWAILPNDKEAADDAFSDEVSKATAFFEQPTPDYSWDEWIRQLVDDDLVCGAIALYPRKTRGGDMHSVLPMDVTMVKRLIDPSGCTPDAPSPAYQQILKGIPAVDYTREELYFWMRNPRTWRLYGYSPVEQIITTVNIALRRQTSQLEYYTEGNIPDMILGVPDTWNPEQIRDVQDIWDSKLEGNTARRRKAQFVPEIKGVILPKDAAVMLTDMADEWFARIVCFAFSIPPSSLLKQVNRASGQQMAETAKEEGLLPMLFWYERKLTALIRSMGFKNVKFAFNTTVEIDPAIKATTNSTYVKSGIMTVDEAREDISLPPKGVDNLIVVTANGAVPLKETLDKATQDLTAPPPPPTPPGPVVLNPGQAMHDPTTGNPIGQANPALPGKEPGAKPGAKKPGQEVPGKKLGKSRGTGVWSIVGKEERRVISQMHSKLKAGGRRLSARAAALMTKGDLEDEALVERVMKELDIDGVSAQVVEELTPTILRLFKEGGISVVADLQIGSDAAEVITAQVDEAAVEFSEQHSADLIKDIGETTRDKVRASVTEGVEKGWSAATLAQDIEQSSAFSRERATTIARTELANAHVQGNLAGWGAAGVVEKKRWIVGDGCCDDCQDLDGVEVLLEESFDYADGPVDGPPAHPNCRCDVEPVLEKQAAGDDNEED